jgi:dynein heavy chain
LRDFNIPKIV